MPALRLPTQSRPTPEVLDTIFFEYVDTAAADYRRLPVNAPYPDALKWPGYFLLKEDPVDRTHSIRWWTNGFANQGTYNYEQIFDKESPSFPIIVRRYAAQKGTPTDIDRTANGAAFSGVWRINVTAGGQNYSSPPSVTITGGSGTGATARALVNPQGEVVAVIIVTDGTGYDSAPQVDFSGGGGTGAIAAAYIQEATCTLVREQHGDFPDDDPRRGRYTIVTRVYRILPGPPVHKFSLRPGGTMNRLTTQDVPVGTYPSGGDGFTSDEVDEITVAEATRKYGQLVDADGTTVITEDDGYTVVTTDPQTDGLLAITYRVRPYDEALPAIGDEMGEIFGHTFYVDFVKQEAMDGSSNVMQIIKSHNVPEPFANFPKVVITFPGTFEFSDQIFVPNSNQFQFPPPWPGDGSTPNTFAQTYPRQRQVVGRVISRFQEGEYTGPTGDAYFIYTPGVASKIFNIPNDTLHRPIKMYESNAGGVFTVEDIPASQPSLPYQPNQILEFPLGAERHIGNLYWIKLLQVSEQTKPEDFPPITDPGQFTVGYFAFSGQNEPTGTINPGGARLILRSSNAGDTMNITLWGRRNTVNGIKWDSQTYALTGTTPVLTEAPIEVSGDNGTDATINRRWYEFFQAILASNNAGDVTVAQQGSPAAGTVTVLTDPPEGYTLEMGPTGLTTTYTFRSPAQFDITCPAASALQSSGAGNYISTVLNGIQRYFWFDVDDGNTDPAPGGTGFEVDVSAGDPDFDVATALSAVIVASVPQFAREQALADIRITAVQIGLASISQDVFAVFTLVTNETGTAQLVNQIRRQFSTDGGAVTETEIAAYIEAAVNADPDFAGDYFSSATGENTYLEASRAGAEVTLTGRDDYSLGVWVLIQSGAAFTLTAITDGADGPPIATIPAAAASPFTSYPDVSLKNAALVQTALGYNPGVSDGVGAIVKNIPAGNAQLTSESMEVTVGEAMRLQYVVTGNPPLPIAYETSPDNAVWTPGAALTPAGGGVLYAEDIGDSVGFVRLKITPDAKARAADIRIT